MPWHMERRWTIAKIDTKIALEHATESFQYHGDHAAQWQIAERAGSRRETRRPWDACKPTACRNVEIRPHPATASRPGAVKSTARRASTCTPSEHSYPQATESDIRTRLRACSCCGRLAPGKVEHGTAAAVVAIDLDTHLFDKRERGRRSWGKRHVVRDRGWKCMNAKPVLS